jgi:hypothetical protein
MLGQISGVFAPPSTHVLADIRPILSNYAPLQDLSNFRRLAADVARLIEANVLEWPGGAPSARQILNACNGISLEHLFCAALDAAAQQRGLTKWLSKDLENVYYLENLESASPHLKLIHLVRDPRDVALSFSQAPIGPKDPRAIALAWARDQIAALACRERIAEGRWAEIRYEDLVSQTENTMRRLCAHFELSYSPAIFQFFLTSDAIDTHRLSPLWKNLALPVTADNAGKWLRREHRPFVELVEATCYNMLVTMGYEPRYVHRQKNYTDRDIRAIMAADEDLRATKEVIRTQQVLERRSRRKELLTEFTIRGRH